MKKVIICSSLAAAAAAALAVAGCGSGGSGMTATSTLTGNASVPSSQAASLPQRNSLFAMMTRDIIGGPAQATAAGGNVPLAGATVALQTRLGHAPVGSTSTTHSDGSFSITIPAGASDLEVVVTKTTTSGDAVVVKSAVQDGQTSTAVDETTTVGADAAEQEEADGLDPQDAAADAAAVDTQQQQDENNGEPPPDVHQSHQAASNGPHQLALTLLTANLGQKLAGQVGHSHHDVSVRMGVMAAITYARTHTGFNTGTLPGDWVVALANGAGSYTDAQVAAALTAGGVTAATATSVDTAVQTLVTNLGLQQTVSPTTIPAGLVVLLLLQQVSTPTSMDAAVSSITGTTVTGSHTNHA